MTSIKRPDLVFDEKHHKYYLDGRPLDGVSSVAKVGEDEIWGVASAWAWRIGYEGAWELARSFDLSRLDHPDGLRQALKEARKTPWVKRDDAADRGNAIHDALEHLAQKGEVPILEQYPKKQRGYVQALCRWFLDYRPEFVATEVQVVSEKHGYAGRYDLRCMIYEPGRLDPEHKGDRPHLLLIDLKTGKRIYPTSQYVQLEGYELASVEMGYAPTDARFVLNVREDGSYEFARSIATSDDFLCYLHAYRAIKRIKAEAKEGK